MLQAKYEEYEVLQQRRRLMEYFNIDPESEGAQEALTALIQGDMMDLNTQFAENVGDALENQEEFFKNFNSQFSPFFDEYTNNLNTLRELRQQLIDVLNFEDYIKLNDETSNLVNYSGGSSGGSGKKYITISLNSEGATARVEDTDLNRTDWEAQYRNDFIHGRFEQAELDLSNRQQKMDSNGNKISPYVKSNQEVRDDYDDYVPINVGDGEIRMVDPTDEYTYNGHTYNDSMDYSTFLDPSSPNYIEDEGERAYVADLREDKQDKYDLHDITEPNSVYGYAKGILGGPVTYTGLTMLHGTPSEPEYVLNSDQAYNLLRYFSTAQPEIASTLSASNDTIYQLSGDIVLNGVNDPEEFWEAVTNAMDSRFSVTKNK